MRGAYPRWGLPLWEAYLARRLIRTLLCLPLRRVHEDLICLHRCLGAPYPKGTFLSMRHHMSDLQTGLPMTRGILLGKIGDCNMGGMKIVVCIQLSKGCRVSPPRRRLLAYRGAGRRRRG